MTVTPMMQQYLNIKSQYPDTLLFFRLGDFYELFGDDAIVASKVLEITLTSRDRGNKEDRLPMCGVPHHAAAGYLEKLVKNGYRVAICEQLEDPKQAKGVVKRDVVRVISPGTFIEGNLEEKRNVYLVGLATDCNDYGLAIIDLSTGEFKVTLLESSDKLKDELMRIQPAEIVVSETMDQELLEICQVYPTTITKTPARNWFLESCHHLLLTHFNLKNTIALGFQEELLIQVAGGVLNYIKETQKAALPHITHITRYSLADFLQIDGTSQYNLELTRTIREGKTKGSLLSILDETVTSMGGRLLRSWLEKPLINIEEIKKRQRAIGYLVDDPLLRSELEEALTKVLDIERLLSKLVNGSGNARDLLALKVSLQQIPAVKELLANNPTMLGDLSRQLDPLSELVTLIEQSIVEEPPITIREGNLIKDGFNSELDQLRAAKRDGKQWIANLEAEERNRTGIKSLKVGYNKVFGYYIEVTRANLANVPDDYQRKQTLANAERFITPELKEKEALILGAEERSADLEYELFVQIRNQVNDYISEIQKNSAILATIDVLQGLAVVAYNNNYVCPEITEDLVLDIKDGRHPVVEALQPNFVPNDINLGEDQFFVLLTGPNMAGKSTYLRQTALIVIMAQMGSFVPASAARIGLVDRIFTRIGAADDLSTGQSTFMVECAETANLVKNSTIRSLIILDELGRGTSTFDGMAIAQSVVEFIHNRIKARTLFSTHYHELTKLEKELKGLITYKMAVEEAHNQVYFLHKVMPGNADRSYGINVAKMAGMPLPIIERAEVLLYQLEADQQKPLQLNLFQSLEHPAAAASEIEHEILQEIRGLDLNRTTPLEALQFLADLKDRIDKED
ncbi:MAG: DNA mismatch repair protein MutS [Firmicutes bacterium]|nr:DNA mismatch repair protein MutS [Bacillota bacterium]